MRLLDIDINDCGILDNVNIIYHSSFPEKERRLWSNLLALIEGNVAFSLKGIFEDDDFKGFITVWNFGDFRYVEHFAIDNRLRNGGIGGKALQMLIGDGDTPVVLEVEPAAEGDMAKRRIEFYRRNGFVPHPEFEYVQLPYSESLPPVPLMLMSSGDVDLNLCSKIIKEKVYGYKE